MNNIKIKKREGGYEYFNIDKLIVSIGKSGVPLKESEKIAKKIKKWILSEKNSGQVDSNKIRDKIIKLISKKFPAEADSFRAYKK